MSAVLLAAARARYDNGELQDASFANQANRVGAGGGRQRPTVCDDEVFFLLEKQHAVLILHRSDVEVPTTQIRGICDFRVPRCSQFKSFEPNSRLRSLAPFSA